MKTYWPVVLILVLLLAVSCLREKTDDVNARTALEQEIQKLTQRLTQLEIADNVDAFLQYYTDYAISMPEYQLTLHGREEIKDFYHEIFSRQNIKAFQRQVHEFIHLGKTIVEVGAFQKEYTDSKTAASQSVKGKYWMVWETQPDGNHKLKGEAFGFFHPVENPESLIVQSHKPQPDESDVLEQKEIPFELKAYNALMEKGVRNRDGNLRAEFFTTDGIFYPFADTAVKGMDQIKPYLIAYSSRGSVIIDSIMCYTDHFENIGDYLIEYAMFKVKWRVTGFSGRTEGKGIRIWKRQDDRSLRLYREIGTHNQLE